MNDLSASIVTVLLAIVGVAVIAVLVSKNSNTAGLFNSGSAGFSRALETALGPVSGSQFGLTGFTGLSPLG